MAINSRWILTAAHIADDFNKASFTLNGATYTEINKVLHSAAADPNNSSNADLALVLVDKDLPGFYDIYFGT